MRESVRVVFPSYQMAITIEPLPDGDWKAGIEYPDERGSDADFMALAERAAKFVSSMIEREADSLAGILVKKDWARLEGAFKEQEALLSSAKGESQAPPVTPDTREKLAPQPRGHKPRKPRPATKKQLDYARDLGFSVNDDIPFAEISELLSTFQSVRYYFWWLFEDRWRMTCKDAGISDDSANATVRQIMGNRILRDHIVKTESEAYDIACARSDAAWSSYEEGRDQRGRFTGMGGPEPSSFRDYMPPRPRDWAYEAVVRIVEGKWPHLVRRSPWARLWEGLTRLFGTKAQGRR